MRADVDVEEVDGPAALLVDDRRALPYRPAVVVSRCGDGEGRVVRPLLRPRPRECAGEILVVDLEDDLPVVAAVADDHARANANCSRWASSSSTCTTSPYFASMS